MRLFGAALFADPAAVKLGAIYSLQMLFFVVVAAATARKLCRHSIGAASKQVAIAAEVSTFLVQDAGSACKAVARGIQPGAVISRRAKARSGLFSEGWFLAFGGGVHDKPRRAPRPGSME